MSAVELLQCYNKGCGQKFKEEENSDDVCRHHPGNPVFHDALKGWSCCPKKCTDFTDFLNIPGCTTGRHNPVKPPEPAKNTEKPLKVGEEIIVKPPPPLEKVIAERPPEDLPYVPLKTKVSSSLRNLLARLKVQDEEEKAKEGAEEKEAAENSGEVKVGTTCKNKGCTNTYQGQDSNFTQCLHHPGVPIFHEGYKFWTCCQRRTSDFNEFLRQEGCTSGDHVWIETEKNAVSCRYDWHQTGSSVVVSIFTKGCVPERCLFEANPTSVRVFVCYENGKSEHQLNLRLFGVIDPEKSSVELLGTKAEVRLRKAAPISWATLQLAK